MYMYVHGSFSCVTCIKLDVHSSIVAAILDRKYSSTLIYLQVHVHVHVCTCKEMSAKLNCTWGGTFWDSKCQERMNRTAGRGSLFMRICTTCTRAWSQGSERVICLQQGVLTSEANINLAWQRRSTLALHYLVNWREPLYTNMYAYSKVAALLWNDLTMRGRNAYRHS